MIRLIYGNAINNTPRLHTSLNDSQQKLVGVELQKETSLSTAVYQQLNNLMTDKLKKGSKGEGQSTAGQKSESQLAEESKMNPSLPTGYMGDQNDYSESMLLGQFPDNFDVSDACGWMTHDDYTDFQQQKRFEANDGQQIMFNGDNRYNSGYTPDLVGLQVPQMNNQIGQGMLQNNSQTNQNSQQGGHQIHLSSQLVSPLLQTHNAQPPKVQDIILSSSQYNQQLHEMHLHHLEQISHTTNSSEYYNRPLEGPRNVLPIDSMNHETGTMTLFARDITTHYGS